MRTIASVGLALALLAGAASATGALPPATGESHQHRGHAHHRFDDAEKWARVFESRARDAWQKPARVVRTLALPPDARVADLGAGTGYFAVRLARALPRGRVYAVDIEQAMVRYLEKRARKEKLPQIVPVLAARDDPRLPEPVDLVLIVDTYHHVFERPAYFRRLRAKLRPGGRVAVIDFRPGSPKGPPDREKVPPEQVIREMREAGYTLVAQPGFLRHQYFLVFTPAPG